MMTAAHREWQCLIVVVAVVVDAVVVAVVVLLGVVSVARC